MEIAIISILSVISSYLWYVKGKAEGMVKGRKEGREQYEQVDKYFEMAHPSICSPDDMMGMLKGRIETDLMTENRDN